MCGGVVIRNKAATLGIFPPKTQCSQTHQGSPHPTLPIPLASVSVTVDGWVVPGVMSSCESVLSRMRQGGYKQDLFLRVLSFLEISPNSLSKFQIYSLQDQTQVLGTEVSTTVEPWQFTYATSQRSAPKGRWLSCWFLSKISTLI